MASPQENEDKRRSPGRPSFKPTDQQRGQVQGMAAVGTPEDQIALVLDIDPKTLRKHFRRELDSSMPSANAQVANRLFRDCLKDDPRYQTSRIFWLKTRCGWKETQTVEHFGSLNLTRDPNDFSDEELAAIAGSRSTRASDQA